MKLSRQFLVFVMGGLLCAAIDIGAMQALILGGANYMIAATVGFFLGLLVNYVFHATLTFRSAMTLPTLLRFLSVVGINYLLTIGFVSLSFSMFENALIGKIASLPFIAVNGFLLSKHWVFK